MYRPDTLNGVDWDGPPETWLKASTVLIDFVQPLGLDHAPARTMEDGLNIAAAVWSAVVLADTRGDRQNLDDLLARSRRLPQMREMVEFLIARKRASYPKDTRLMVVEGCTRVSGRIDVRVTWSMA